MLLVDVDALSKLAHWNLLEALPDLSGYSWLDIATLTSVKHRAHRAISKPDMRTFHTAAAATAVFEACYRLGQLPASNEALLAQMEDTVGMDSGEAVLFSSLGRDDRLLTGDKRALRALCSLECCHQFEGKVWMVEQFVEACLTAYGREWLLERICPQRQLDKAVSSVLGYGCDANEADIRDGLASNISEIARLRKPSILFA